MDQEEMEVVSLGYHGQETVFATDTSCHFSCLCMLKFLRFRATQPLHLNYISYDLWPLAVLYFCWMVIWRLYSIFSWSEIDLICRNSFMFSFLKQTSKRCFINIIQHLWLSSARSSYHGMLLLSAHPAGYRLAEEKKKVLTRIPLVTMSEPKKVLFWDLHMEKFSSSLL